MILKNDTRWNSKYLSFERLNNINIYIDNALDYCNLDTQLKSQRKIPRKLQENQKKELKALLKFLEPFYDATKQLEGNDTCNISHVLICLKALNKHILKFNNDEFNSNPIFKEMFNYLKIEFKNAYETIPLCYKISIYFHPAVRDKILLKKEKKEIRKFILEEYKIINISLQKNEKRKLLDLLADSEEEDENNSSECQNDEFSKYEEIKWFTDPFSDPIEFWKQQKNALPILSLVAKDYLCIGSSAANIERLWSMAGRVVTKGRSNLSPETISNIVFAMGNYELQNLPIYE